MASISRAQPGRTLTVGLNGCNYRTVAAAVAAAEAGGASAASPWTIQRYPGAVNDLPVIPASVRIVDMNPATPELWVASYYGAAGDDRFFIGESRDGITWRNVQHTGGPVSYIPAAGMMTMNPTLFEYRGRFYCLLDNDFATGTLDVVVSDDLVTWTDLVTLTFDAITNTTTAGATVFWDDDGLPHLIATCTNAADSFKQYERHPNSADPSTWGSDANWSAKVALQGAAGDLNDYTLAQLIKHEGVYHLFGTDDGDDADLYIDHLTASALAGPYTVVGDGDWAGWGFAHAINIVPLPNGLWRAYMEPMLWNDPNWEHQPVQYSDSVTDDLGGTWGAPAAITYPPGEASVLHLAPVHVTNPATMATAAAGKGANGRVLKVLDATLSVDITEADTYVGTGVAFYIPAGVIVTGFFIVAGAPGGTAAAGAKTINYSIGTVANADADLTDATDIDVMHASGEKTAASVHGDVAADYGTDGGDWFNGTIDAHSKYVDAYTTLQLNYIGKCAAGGGHVDGTVTCAFKVYAIMDMLPL